MIVFQFQILGANMTPKVKIFEDVFPDSSTGVRFVAKFGENRPLRSCRKVVWSTKQKTRALRDSSQHPFWPKWADRAQNSPNVVTPWSWSGSAAFCRTYSGMIDFSVQKVNRLSTSNEVKHSRDFETSCDYRIQMDAGFVTAKKQTTTTTST